MERLNDYLPRLSDLLEESQGDFPLAPNPTWILLPRKGIPDIGAPRRLGSILYVDQGGEDRWTT